MNNLSENSKSYYSQADIYEEFTQAEDYPNYIRDTLAPMVKGQLVLDLGCGNGKYCELLYNYCDIIGVDKSFEQLKKAKRINPSVHFFQADMRSLPFLGQFDTILSCWALGTLIHENEQLKALSSMKKSLKAKGQIILVENSECSEFEELRGRDKDNRTFNYNQFLISQGFQLYKEIDTYFQFSSSQQAHNCFKNIWENNLTKDITQNTIEHKVSIFVFTMK